MQIIAMPKEEKHYLYFKRGRVGDPTSGDERLDERTNVGETIKEFKQLFEDITGNEFEPWEREKKFNKKRLKFYPIDMVNWAQSCFYLMFLHLSMCTGKAF